MEWVAVLKRIREEAKGKANGKTPPSKYSQRLTFFPIDLQDKDSMACPFGKDARKRRTAMRKDCGPVSRLTVTGRG